MRSGTKYTLTALAAVGVLLLGDLVLYRGAASPRPKQKLPDGRIIQLLGSTEGSIHTLPSPWHARYRRFLPDAIQRSLGPNFSGSFGFGRPGLALWLMCYDPSTDTYQQNWINHSAIVDEHGCLFPASGYGNTGDGVHHATIASFPAYPRQASSFILRIYDFNAKVLADFTIPNPHISTAATVWVPETLPVWKTNSPLTLRLDGPGSEPMKPSYQIFRNGQPEDHWVPQDVWFEDPSGNTGQFLCRKLSAWKWRTRFHRSAEAPFSPEETIAFTNLTVPQPGELLSIPVRARVGETELTNLGFAGPGRYEFTNGVLAASIPWRPGMSQSLGTTSSSTSTNETRGTKNFSLFLPRLPIPSGARLIARARTGERFVSAATSAGSTARLLFLDLDQPLTNEVVDLDLIVDPGYNFEAILSPSVFERAK